MGTLVNPWTLPLGRTVFWFPDHPHQGPGGELANLEALSPGTDPITWHQRFSGTPAG